MVMVVGPAPAVVIAVGLNDVGLGEVGVREIVWALPLKCKVNKMRINVNVLFSFII